MNRNSARKPSVLARFFWTALFFSGLSLPSASAEITFPQVPNVTQAVADPFPVDITFPVSASAGTLDLPVASDTTVVSNIADNLDGTYTATFESFALVTILAVERDGGGAVLDRKVQTFGVVPSDPGGIVAALSFDDVGSNNVVSVGSDTNLTASGPGGAVTTFTYDDPSIAVVQDGVLTALASGTVRVTFNFIGNTTFAPANSLTKTVTVKAGQTITFPALADVNFQTDLFVNLNATSSSGLQVSYAITGGQSIAEIEGNGLTVTGAGTITVEATQPGDGDFAAAAPVARTFNVNPGQQVITFFGETGSEGTSQSAPLFPLGAPPISGSGSISGKTTGDSIFTLSSTNTSGLAVSYQVYPLPGGILPAARGFVPVNPVTIDGNTVEVSDFAADTAQVIVVPTANASANFQALTAIDSFNAGYYRVFTLREAQNISINTASLLGKELGDPAFIPVVNNVDTTVSIAVSSGPAAIINPATNLLTMFGIGVVNLEAFAPQTSYAGTEAILYESDTDSESFVVGGVEPSSGPGFLDLWTWRSPTETGNQFYNDITPEEDNAEMISVGDGGQITQVTIDPSGNVIPVTVGAGVTAENLNGIAHNNANGYVVVGDSRTVLTSANGIAWATVDISGLVPATVNLHAIASSADDNSFLAVGVDTSNDAAVVLSSPTGAFGTWTVESDDIAFPGLLRGLNRVAYNDAFNRWITVGDDGSIASRALAGGGGDWSAEGGLTPDFYGIHVEADGKTFIVGENGTVMSSTDPTFFVWKELFSGTSYDLYQITAGNGFLVAVGEDGRVLTSFDGNGELWTESVSRFPLDMRGVAYYLGLFYAAGQNYTIISAATGLEWTQRSSSQPGSLFDVAGNETALVAVGTGGRILRSTDEGQTWSLVASGTLADLYGVAVKGSTFIAVGEGGEILVSTDQGATWPTNGAVNTDRFAAPFNSDLFDVIYDPLTDAFLAVGERSSIIRSVDDGANWLQLRGASPGSGTNHNSVAVSDLGDFVIVGDNGRVLTSANGQDWAGASSGISENLHGVTYGEGQFVAVGDAGRLITSVTGQNWETQISGFFDDFRDVTYADGVFVAVGALYSFVASEDGENWSAQISGSQNFLFAVAVIDERFVAVGEYDAILTATTVIPTGLDTWTLRNPLADGDTLNDVAFGNDTFVAVGDNGRLLVSNDGKTWVEKEITESDGTPLTQDLFGVAYGNGIYLAVGGNKLLYSSDANTWTVITTWLVPVNSVSFGGGIFVVTGESAHLFHSVDGINWDGGFQTSEATTADLLAAHYSEDEELWVATGEAAPFTIAADETRDMTMIFTSPNGINWTRHQTPLLPGEDDTHFTGTMRGAAFGNGRFLLSGDGGLGSFNGSSWFIDYFGWNSNASIFTEANGQGGFFVVGDGGLVRGFFPGFLSFPGVTENLNGIAFGKQTFVAVGQSGRILNSDDARSWSVRSAQNLADLNALTVNSLGKYVAVGENGSLLYSEDSIAWTPAVSIPNAAKTTEFFDVTAGDDEFIAVGELGSILVSTDGQNWGSTTPPLLDDFRGVAFGNGLLVAVGLNGAVATSLDGNNWTAQLAPTTQHLFDIWFADNTFVAVGTNGTVLTSTDGVNWATPATPPSVGLSLYSIGYGDINGTGTWVASGQNGILFSAIDPNGVWSSLDSGTTNDLYDISFGLGNFFIAGFDGTSITSNDAIDWFRRPTNTTFQLNGTTFFNGIFTAVGEGSTIITSGDIQPRLDQSIIFNAIPAKTVSDPAFNLQAAATSDLPVSFAVISGPATISGNTVTLNGSTGQVVVEATQAGNIRYNPAPPVQRSFEVFANNQAITFFGEPGSGGNGSIADKTFGVAPFPVEAVVDSGLFANISVQSGNASITSLEEGVATVQLTGAGKIVLVATQSGAEGNFAPAAPVERSFEVAKGTQTITFPSPGVLTLGDPPVTLGASASSGLDVSYAVLNGPGEIINGNELQINASGTIEIQASQEGNANYLAATPVTLSVTVQPEQVGTVWQGRSSSSTANLKNIEFIAGTFYASGDKQTILTSLGGTTWSPIVGGVGTLNGIAVGGVPTLYVAVGSNGIALSSDNGSSWKTVNSPVAEGLNAITFGNGRFVAVGNSGLIVTSLNGINWTTITEPGITEDLRDVLAYDGRFYLVGGNAIVRASADLTEFEKTPFGSGVNLNAITFGDDELIVVGDAFTVLTSSDSGNNWSPRPAAFDNDLHDISFGTNRYIAVGSGGGIFTSSDLTSWVKRESGVTTLLNSVTFTDEIFVIVGDSGTLLTSGSASAKTAQDINFSAIVPPASGSTTTTLQAAARNATTGARSLLPVAFNVIVGNATVSGTSMNAAGLTTATLTIEGDGAVAVRASQPGNSAFYAAPNVDQTVGTPSQSLADISPAAGTLNFTTSPITLSATAVDAVSGLPTGIPMQYAIVSGQATLRGDQMTLASGAAGTSVVVRFFNDGDAVYDPVSENVTYNVTSSSSEIIFDKIQDKLLSDAPFFVTAQTVNGATVNVTILSQVDAAGNPAEIASIRSFDESDEAGNVIRRHQVTLKGTDAAQGRVTLRASKDGATATQSFYVSKLKQNVTFVDPGEKQFGDADFDINATADGGGNVTLRLADSSANAVARLDGTTLKIQRAGTITVIGSADPVGDYGPAENELTITVKKADQRLEFEAIKDRFAEPSTIRLRARTFINDDEQAANPADFRIVFSLVRGSNIASISGDTLTLTGERGTITVQAAQAGNENVNPATAVERTFVVSDFARVNIPGSGNLRGAAFGNNRRVVVGDGGAIYYSDAASTDPLSWRFVAGPTTFDLRDIAFGMNYFVAVGFNGSIIRATHGTNWSLTSTDIPVLFNGIAFGDNRFVAVSAGGIGYTSTDMIKWTQVDLGTLNPLQAVTYGRNDVGEPVFVAVGQVGAIVTSGDGQNWVQRDSGSQLSLNGVAYGNGLFVAVGDKSTYFYSTNGGVTWQRHTIPVETLTSEEPLQSVSYGAASFRVVGPNGLVLTASPAAIIKPVNDAGVSQWSKDLSLGTQTLFDVSFAGNRFVTVGQQNTILVSVEEFPFTQDAPLANGWRYNPWLGALYTEVAPWVYSDRLGWMYLNGTEESLWSYSLDLGWTWTAEGIFPFVYQASSGEWLYSDDTAVGERAFFGSTSKQWLRFAIE